MDVRRPIAIDTKRRLALAIMLFAGSAASVSATPHLLGAPQRQGGHAAAHQRARPEAPLDIPVPTIDPVSRELFPPRWQTGGQYASHPHELRAGLNTAAAQASGSSY
jgi:hypothetical protein